MHVVLLLVFPKEIKKDKLKKKHPQAIKITLSCRRLSIKLSHLALLEISQFSDDNLILQCDYISFGKVIGIVENFVQTSEALKKSNYKTKAIWLE